MLLLLHCLAAAVLLPLSLELPTRVPWANNTRVGGCPDLMLRRCYCIICVVFAAPLLSSVRLPHCCPVSDQGCNNQSTVNPGCPWSCSASWTAATSDRAGGRGAAAAPTAAAMKGRAGGWHTHRRRQGMWPWLPATRLTAS